MRFVVMGAGGVGGFFGAALARAGEDVWFVGRGKHFDAMQREGLHIASTVGNFTIPPSQIVKDTALIGPANVILFCVKSYDTEAAARQLAPLLNERSLIISLQNGVDNVEKIAALLPHCSTYGGAAYISSRITAPGQITETGGFHSKWEDFEVTIPQDAKQGGHKGVIEEFVRCARSGGTPETICTDNIKSLAMVFGAIESADRGERVTISEKIRISGG